MNWTRVKPMLVTCAKARAISVFARPGKSSIRTWPSARIPSSTSSSASRLPMTARSTSSRTSFARPASWSTFTATPAARPGGAGCRRGIPGACRSVGAARSSRASSHSSGPSTSSLVLEPQPAGGEPDADDLAHDRPQAGVGVERRGVRHRQLALEPVELGRALGLGRVAVERLGERRALLDAERPRAPRPRRCSTASAPTTRMKMSSSSSNQPGASSRANRSAGREQHGQEEPGAEQPPHAAARAPRARRARRAGRRGRRSRRPSSSRRSRGG